MISMPMTAVIRRHEDTIGSDWFAPRTMRFFRTRLPKTAVRNKDHAYFVTSERAPNSPRRYSVRCMDLGTGKIETLGWFNGYATRGEAMRAMINAMKGGV